MEESDPWPSSPSDYEVQHKIGHGAFSTVFKAHCEIKNIDVSIKMMDLESMSSGILKRSYFMSDIYDF